MPLLCVMQPFFEINFLHQNWAKTRPKQYKKYFFYQKKLYRNAIAFSWQEQNDNL